MMPFNAAVVHHVNPKTTESGCESIGEKMLKLSHSLSSAPTRIQLSALVGQVIYSILAIFMPISSNLNH